LIEAYGQVRQSKRPLRPELAALSGWLAATAQCGEHAAFQSGREHEGTLSTPWCSPAAGLARGAGLFIALSLAMPLCVLDLC
jgi:hypothetical protein